MRLASRSGLRGVARFVVALAIASTVVSGQTDDEEFVDRVVPQTTQTWPASSLTFVMDTTGSMQDDLSQVKRGANDIFFEILSQSDLPVQNFILVPFHDPNVGPVTVTRSTEVFKRALDDLYVDGGGDCEEKAITGIELALKSSLPGSFVFVFTDASAKDFDRTDSVINLIQSTRSQVVFVLTGDCGYRNSPEYQAFEKIAVASKGEIFHLDKKRKVGPVLKYIGVLVGSRQVSLYYGINHPPSYPDFAVYHIPVDSCLQQLVISVSTNGSFEDVREKRNVPVVEAIGPTGRRNFTFLVDENSVKTIHEEHPKPGIWEVRIKSNLPYSLVVDGRSVCNFKITFFYTHIPGAYYQRPVIGQRTNIILNGTDVDLTNTSCRCYKAVVTNMTFLRLNNEVMWTIPLEWKVGKYFELVEQHSFVAPAHEFLVMVSGRDENGYQFQRISPTIIAGKAERPEVIEPQTSLIWAVQGRPVLLRCGYRSIVSVQILWQKNGILLSDDDERYAFFDDGRLFVLNVTGNDGGIYQCNLRSSEGNASGFPLNVSIAEAPSVFLFSDDLAVEPGQEVEFSCTVKGRPAPGIKWLVNGSVISPYSRTYDAEFLGSHFSTLKIPKANVRHKGEYSCQAENVAGSITKTLLLKIQVGPRLSILPEEATVREGDNVKFVCRGEGLPPPQLDWYRGGRLLASQSVSQSEKQLILSNIRPSDQGSYTCVGRNAKGLEEEVVHLTVHVVPSFVTTPSDESVVRARLVVFNCFASGNPLPILSWMKDGVVIKSSGRFAVGVSGKTLAIGNVQPEDVGRYSCVAENAAGRKVAAAILTVIIPPEIRSFPSPLVRVVSDGCAWLDCQAKGSPSPTVAWYQGSDRILNGRSSSRFRLFTNGTLRICDLSEVDSGQYECRADNSGGQDQQNVQLDVQYRPVLARRLDDQWIQIGRGTVFVCEVAKANPPAKITWEKDGNFVVDEDGGRVDITGRDGDRLAISSVEEADGGEYQCYAENDVGRISSSGTLFVIVPPTFSPDHSAFVVVKRSQSAFLHCQTSGFPKPAIAWFRGDGNEMITSTPTKYEVFPNGTLQIRNVQTEDSGVYRCVANNRGGREARNVTVNVQYAPFIVSASTDQSVFFGNGILLSCEGVGNPQPSVRWLKDGREVGRGAQLRIASAQPHNAGVYSCIVENLIGQQRANMRMTVIVGARIERTSSTGVSVESGHSVWLHCNASGIPTPIVNWFHGGRQITGDKLKYVTFLNGTLRINNVQVDNDGFYRCQAINRGGRDSLDFNLDVQYKPSITTSPKERKILVGECVRFNCSGYGNPSPLIFWQKEGRLLSTGQGVRISLDGSQLNLCPVKASSAGLYTCIIRNKIGHSKIGALLTVLVPPEIDSEYVDIRAVIGQPVFLPCDATGIPIPTITWFKDGIRITNNPSKFRIFSNGTLRIDTLTKSDAGEYQCIAVNEGGPNQKNVSLDVHYGPSVTTISSDKSVVTGNDVRFHCTVSSNPPAAVTWLKDGSPLSPHFRIAVSHDGLRLSISDVRSSDSGTYTCVAENYVDDARSSTTLAVVVPSTIVSNIDKMTVVVGSVALLPCETHGVPPPTIEWLRNGTAVEEVLPKWQIMTNGTLRIQNVEMADAGDYQCVATNKGGQDAQKIDLDVNYGAVISSRPRNKEVTADSDVTFRCGAIGNPQPRLTWDRDGVALTSGSRLYVSVNGAVLTVRDVQPNDTAYYTCTARNVITNGKKTRTVTATASARLDVIVRPYFAEEVGIDVVVGSIGDPAWLPCNVNGIPPPSIRWLKNGRPVSGFGYFTMRNGTLRILRIKREDGEGLFQCVAKNKAGEIRKNVSLNVQYESSIVMISSDRTVLMNQSVQLECKAEGNPSPSVHWEYQRKQLTNSMPGVTVSSDGSVLLLENVQPSHSGWYVCVANNSLQQDTAAVAIDVLEPPSPLGKISSTLERKKGDAATLLCDVTGSPSPAISWFGANGKQIDARDPRFQIVSSTGALQIYPLQLSDNGTYVCNATNPAGSVTLKVTLDVQYSPTVTRISQDQTVLVGAAVDLVCSAEGNPLPALSWEFSGLPFGRNSSEVVTSLGSSRLTIFSIKPSDDGVYTCVAENVVSETRKSVVVSVLDPPRLVKRVREVSVKEGGVAFLPCEVKGSPRPNVYWVTSDGLTVPPITLQRRVLPNNTLQITNVKLSDSGLFYCIATNDGGSINVSLSLNVQYPPTISTITDHQSVVKDSVITLECSSDGNPSPQIHWQFMDRPVVLTSRVILASDGSLTIQNARSSDGGWYTCVAVNSVGSQKLSTKIDVIEPPVLTKSRIGITSQTQLTVWLPCSVSGSPKPTISWSKDGSPIDLGDPRYQVMRNGTLRISRLVVGDDGVYECEAANPGGRIAVNTTVNVEYPPQFVQPLKDQSVFRTMTVSFSCIAHGNPQPEIVWSLPGHSNGLEVSLNGGLAKISYSSDQSTLTIKNAQPANSGYYQCAARNRLGFVTSIAKLEVVVNTTCLQPFTAVEVVQGRIAWLPCSVAGIPPPQVSWHRNRTDILPGRPRHQLLSNGSLRVNDVNFDDRGLYECEAVNSGGKAKCDIRLVVLIRPELIVRPQTKSPLVGGDVTFVCDAVGNPRPMITWKKGFQTIRNGQGNVQISSDGTTLTIKNVQLDDAGWYECTASNKVSHSESSVQLDVRVSPTVVMPPIIHSVLGSSAQLTCSVSGTPVPVVRWYVEGRRVNAVSFPRHRLMGDQSLRITDVQLSDDGRYTCQAVNTGGQANGTTTLDVLYGATIIKGPQDVRTLKGQTVTMTCEADGNPPPVLRWTKGLKSMQHLPGSVNVTADGTLLTIVSVKTSDKGWYTCLAENNVSSEAESGRLRVFVPPDILQIRKNESVEFGGDALIQCIVNGQPTPEVKWLKNGTEIEGGDSGGRYAILADNSLRITDLQREDSGTYECVAVNKGGEDRLSVVLNVLIPVSVSMSPEYQEIPANATAVFTCVATGNPVPSIVWRKEGASFASERTRNLSSPGRSVLIIERTSPVDSGRYVCVANNDVGSDVADSSELKITVIPAVNVTNKTALYYIQGGDVFLDCLATGVPTPEIYWEFNGVRVDVRRSKYQLFSNGTLKTNSIERSDGGNYSCVARNKIGSATGEINVIIWLLPRILRPSVVNHVITKGNLVFMDCQADGNPTPFVSWERLGGGAEIRNGVRHTVFPNGTLKIALLSEKDGGRYLCTAQSQLGSVILEHKLDVTVPPRIRPVEQPVTNVGRPAFLNCPSSGEPFPAFQWSFQGEPIEASSRHRLFKNGTLIIVKANDTDTGLYTCLATNRAGIANMSVFLFVRVAPAIVDFKDNVTVPVGGIIQLPCGATGKPTPDVKWFFDGLAVDVFDRRVIVTESGTLRVSRVSRDDAGRYSCEARNPAGVDVRAVDVDVYYTPTVLTLPYDANATLGGTVELPCESVGNPVAKVSWTIPASSQRFTVLPSGSLRIEEIEVGDAGTYICTAGNQLGNQSVSVHLDVLYSPFIIASRQHVTVTEGQQSLLPCLTIANPEPKITWTINGKDVADGSGRFRIFDNGTLFITTVQDQDDGKATCKAINSVGFVQLTHRISVKVKPVIISSGEMFFSQGETGLLPCVAKGRPTPTIAWYFNGKPVKSLNNTKIRVLKSGQLRLKHVTRSQSGTYTCEATNEVDQDRHDVSVVVRFRPYFPNKKRQQARIETFRGGRIFLSCNVIGLPRPAIIWMKDGEALTLPDRRRRAFGNGTLRIEEVQPSDAGQYTCRAENVLGMGELKTTVVVKVEPRIVSFPEDVTVIFGKSLKLKCAAIGYPVPTIFWLKDGASLGNNRGAFQLPDGSLYLRRVGKEDAGNYTCRVSNSLGKVAASAHVQILDSPKIISVSPTVVALTGKTAILRCTVSGNSLVAYKWFKGVTELTSNERFTIDSLTGVLTIHSLQVQDGGVYRCTATNEAGLDSVRIELTIMEPVSVDTPRNSDHVVRVGVGHRLECRARGAPMPTIAWFKDGKPISANGRLSVGDSYLFISAVRPEDTGTYECRATNDIGTANITIHLTVQFSPRVTAGPPSQKSTPGSRVDFHCNASGFPRPSIQWVHNGFYVPGTVLVHRNGTLTLNSVRQSDSGGYQCLATNILGVATSNTLYLDIESPPEIISASRNVSATVGASAVFRCVATGTPSPTITWTHNGIVVQPTWKYFVDSRGLQMNYIEEADEGIFVCRAANTAGSVSTSFYLTVLEPPTVSISRSVSTLLGTSVYHLSVSLSGDPPFTCDWQKGSLDLTRSSRHEVSDVDCSLTIHDVVLSDAGSYRLSVRNRGGVATLVVYLTIHIPVTVRTASIVTAIEGTSVRLHCYSTGFPAPRISWSKDGEKIVTQGRFLVRPDGSLLIYSTEKADAGNYTCNGTNDAGPSNSSIVLLTIAKRPAIAGSITSTETLSENDTIAIPCEVTGCPPPVVQWYRDGEVLHASMGRIRIDENNTLIIENLSASDGGLYRCNATNTVGFAYKTILLIVKVSPVVIGRSSTGASTIVVTCVVEGIFDPSVTWARDGRQLPPDPRYVVTSIPQGSRLTITNARQSDEGTYECRYSGGGSRTVTVFGYPIIISDHETETVIAGQRLDLSCTATGTPLPEISWSKDGVKISPEGRRTITEVSYGNVAVSTLVVVDVSIVDSGRYECRASNSRGSPKHVIIVSVTGTQIVPLSEARTITVVPNTRLNIECTLSFNGVPSNNVQWRYKHDCGNSSIGNWIGLVGGRFVVNREAGTLEIIEIREEDEGCYQCWASGPNQRSLSRNFYLDVRSISRRDFIATPPPKTLPEAVSASSGRSIVLKCPHSAQYGPLVQWYKNGKHVQSDKWHELRVDGSLKFTNLNLHDAGRYECKGLTEDSSVPHTIILDIKGVFSEIPVTSKRRGVPPTIVKTKKQVTRRVGSTATLSCSASGRPIPTVFWWKHNSVVVPGNDLRFSQLSDGSLQIRPLRLTDSGSYTCTATNSEGMAARDTQLIVESSPIIVLPPRNAISHSGRCAELYCKTVGVPKPRGVTWFLDTFELIPDGRRSVMPNGSLIVCDLRCDDSGLYECIAENKLGRTTAMARLKVEGKPPSVSIYPSEVAIPEGSSYNVSCAVIGCSPPEVSWLKDGIPLSNQGQLLDLVKVDARQSGLYTCRAANDAGVGEANFSLLVTVSPSVEVKAFQNPVGTEKTFLHCLVNATPAADVHWLKDGIRVVSGRRQVIFGNHSLSIYPLLKQDTGRYTCIAANDGGVDSADVNVTVTDDPECVASPLHQTVDGGSAAYFSCLSEGSSIAWLRGEKKIHNSSDLMIFGAKVSDSGTYSCEGYDGNGRRVCKSDVELSVTDGPTSPIDLLIVQKGERVVLRCAATLDGNSIVRWLKNGARLIPSRRITHRNDTSIVIKTARHHDAGNYSCVASREDLTVSSVVFLSVVRKKECIRQISGNISGNINDVEIMSSVQGNLSCSRGKVDIHFGDLSAHFTPSIELLSPALAAAAGWTFGEEFGLARNGLSVLGDPPWSFQFNFVVKFPGGRILRVKQTVRNAADDTIETNFTVEGNIPVYKEQLELFTPFLFTLVKSPNRTAIYVVSSQEYRVNQTVSYCYLHGTINFMSAGDGLWLRTQQTVARNASIGRRLYEKTNRSVVQLSGCYENVQGLDECPSGFRNVSSEHCEDIDECLDSLCNQRCENLPGSFICHCQRGFSLNKEGRVCQDINECSAQPPLCSQRCQNTEGSYRCDCGTGFFVGPDGRSCFDIDECETESPSPCEHICLNTPGSYHCLCPMGYLSDVNGGCQDIDECLTGQAFCQHGCQNTPGSYVCTCPGGYLLQNDGRTCSDINECEYQNGNCSRQCFNTYGNYQCIRSSCSSSLYEPIAQGVCVLRRKCSMKTTHRCEIGVFLTSIAVRRGHLAPIANLTAFGRDGRLFATGGCQFAIVNGNSDGLFGVDVRNRSRCNGVLISTRPMPPALRKVAAIVKVLRPDGSTAAATTHIILVSTSQYDF